ncbi:MAG: hypothetical protein JWL90_2014 [Chthoniobacteraceae bacterium]|nr:hypothetical protein [Chthoniobacteraceae bacterium]
MHFPTLSILACVALVLGCHRRLGGEATPKTVRNVPFGKTVYKAEDSFSQGHLGFKAWPVNAADGGLVGVAAEIHNLSKDKPLRMQSVTGSIPIGILLAVARGNEGQDCDRQFAHPHGWPFGPARSSKGPRRPFAKVSSDPMGSTRVGCETLLHPRPFLCQSIARGRSD